MAALYVVLHHSLPHNFNVLGIPLGALLKFGQEAVILFFLLSGFVINYAYQRSGNKHFSHYFFNRFARLYIPLLIIYLLAYVIVCIKHTEWIDPQIQNLVLNMMMLQDIDSLKPGVIVSPYMGNSPLWSLSYEWWFYMLYYPLVTRFRVDILNSFSVWLSIIFASILYVFLDDFLSRLWMYFGIWWFGVFLSQLYLQKKEINFKAMIQPLLALSAVTMILGISSLVAKMQGKTLSFGIHPILEVRHFAFAILVVLLAVWWHKFKWIGFNHSIGGFSRFAPISYVVYISHYYLVTTASYLSFLENKVLEWFGYMVVLIAFSYTLERKLYPRLKRLLFPSTGVRC